ncbi:MAG: hypothetical protein ACRDZ5_05480 [Acidimicrobiales bacterium]
MTIVVAALSLSVAPLGPASSADGASAPPARAGDSASASLSSVVAVPVGRGPLRLGPLTKGYVPPHNPRGDVWPKPDYTFPDPSPAYFEGSQLPPCWKWGAGGRFVAVPTSPRCVFDEVAATDNAHRAERVARIVLPRNFNRLTPAEQSLVLVDIERVSRGETPVLGLSGKVNVFAQEGAKANEDPQLGSGIRGATGSYASNWAAALSPLDANYGWMYTDGWAGKRTRNFDCTSARAPGCWGHRDNILTDASRMACYRPSCTLVMGAGFVRNGWERGSGYNSYTELLVQISGPGPGFYYTWAEAKKAGARG